MIYVIDHKDSFTHNVVHQLSLFDDVKCDDFSKINKSKLNQASTIVFSPGPGSPKDYPLSSKIYKQFKGKKKIIGICLGFQQILFSEGAKIVQQNKIYHGFQSEVLVNKSSKLFNAGSKFKGWSLSFFKIKRTFSGRKF
jgi:anthranilate synthase component 2/para-aminobenzoate synthetase component 2